MKERRGLVVEGGGMRGAHTCGALWAMAQVGQTDFDVVTANSAGACTVAFFISKQFPLFKRVWQNYLHGSQFINLVHLLSPRRSVLDLDYLIHEIFSEKEPLDVEAIRRSPTDFFITATDCQSGAPHYFNAHRDPLLNALKASSAIPFAYRWPVILDGRSFVDGGVADPIPVQKAIDEGCNEVVVLLTRPKGHRKSKPMMNLVSRLYRKRYPILAEKIATQYLRYNQIAERIEQGDFPCKLTVIRPLKPLPVSRLTTHRERILEAIDQGYREALLALTSPAASRKIEVNSRA